VKEKESDGYYLNKTLMSNTSINKRTAPRKQLFTNCWQKTEKNKTERKLAEKNLET
jgi:hypothetical protein